MALAGAVLALTPASAHAQFPTYSKDKFLGSISEFTRPLFNQYFNQITPENGGKWGVAAGTTRTAAMRWGQLDTAYNYAVANNMKFNFHVLLWGNQQPTWMATLPPEEQLAEIKKWYAAVAERYPKIEWLQVVNEPTWDPPDGTTPKNAGANFASSGNYVQALGGAGETGYDWIRTAFRLAKQYFPNTKLMLNDVAITGQTASTDEYLKIINILKAENLVDVVGLQAHAFEFIPNNPNVPSIPGHPYEPVTDMRVHKANLDRLAATGIPIQITELDLDGFAVNGVPGDEMQLSYYRNVVPTFWEHPRVEGITLWGWRQPNHWRNAQNAPIVLSNDTPKPAALWLYNYVRGIAPVIRPDADVHRRRRQRQPGRHGPGRRLGLADQPHEPAHLHVAHHGRQRSRHLRHRPGDGRDHGGQAAAARRAHDVRAEGPRLRRLPRERGDRPSPSPQPTSRTSSTRPRAAPCPPRSR